MTAAIDASLPGFSRQQGRRMRVMCLHGKGSNSVAMKSQIRAVASRLSDVCEFVYFDGPTECEPYPGLDKFYPGPYYSWYSAGDSASIKSAQAHIEHLNDTMGPFDGVAGFSQGGALASLMSMPTSTSASVRGVTHQSLFRFAIFFCSALPMGMGFEQSRNSRPEWLRSISDASRTDLDGDATPVLRRSAATAVPIQPPSASPPLITIPTAHIIGKYDSIVSNSGQLARLCDAQTRSIFEHTKGHLIPRHSSAVLAMEKAIRSMLETHVV